MPKNLKLKDISKNGETQLSGVDINELLPLPPPYDKSEKFPAIKALTPDQQNRLVCNLDGFVALALPRPKNAAEEEKYVGQFVAGLKKLLDKENNWTFLQPLLLIPGLLRPVPDL